jgi:uncharacterized membrane protein YjgN (DUF898 family)
MLSSTQDAPVGQRALTNQPAVPARELAFSFTGSASEYFRIWIVNMALTVVSLGIYSAWAKVRNRQYFLRHTWLDGASFDYTAEPANILKGRAIVAAAFGLVFLSNLVSPVLGGALAFGMVLLVPWAVTSSLAFNARNTSYRNIRFAFTGTAGEAAGLYMLTMLLQVVTLGIATPYSQWRFTQFIITRHLYGDERFNWTAQAKDFYKLYLPIVGMLFLALVLGAVAAFAARSGADMPSPTSDRSGPAKGGVAMMAVIVLVYGGLFVAMGHIKARTANLVLGNTHVGTHQLGSNQRSRDILMLYFTNALALVFSLGLLIPWAQVRMVRYRLEHLRLQASGPLQAGRYEMDGRGGALGEAAHDLGDIDLGIGV